MTDCVDTEDLVAMLDGELAGERVEAVLVHVDQCARCAEIIASLARDVAPRRVGRYQLAGVLGSGGMGVVHEGWDPELRRRVAVKLLRPELSDGASRARMLREARTLARINHPNVVAVHDVGEQDGEIYVATELVDGETLATWCAGRSGREIVGAWIQAARGLAAAHAGGIVHRDVKPANVLVGRDGRVRVGDFGLARLGPGGAPPPTPRAPASGHEPTDHGFPTITDADHVGGTPAYMAPEQWRGAGEARSDQFALSVAVVESLTGTRPDASGAFALPDGTPGRDALARALARGIRDDPGARFPTMAALADALAAAIAPPVKRARAALAGAIAALAIAGGLAAWSLARPAGPRCEVAAVPDDVWSPARRAALERKLPPVIAAHTGAWLTAWSAMATDVCTVDGGAPALRARRQRCLDDALGQARHLLAGWDADAHPMPLVAQLGIELLPRPASCAHAAVLAATEPRPDQVPVIATLRLRMIRARYLDQRDPLPVMRDVADRARALGYTPFVVETATVLADLLATRDAGAAIAVLRDALARTDQARDDRARAQATIELVKRLNADQVEDALALAEPARAGLARLGGEPALEDDLEFALGDVLRSAARTDEAIAAFERARRSAREAYGPDSNHEAMALIALDGAYQSRGTSAPGAKAVHDAAVAIYRPLGMPLPSADDPIDAMIELTRHRLADPRLTPPGSANEALTRATLGLAYQLAGQVDLALPELRGAAELYDRLGIRNASAADAHSSVVQLLLDAGHARDALPEADRAVAVATAIAVDAELGRALTLQGRARLETGDVAGARAVLRDALKLRDRIQAPPTQRGNTRFLYARALWPIDHPRARELAIGAKADIRSYLDSEIPDKEKRYALPMQQRLLAAIDRWLREHPR